MNAFVSESYRARLKAERRFILSGRLALYCALLLLFVLLGTLTWRGIGGFAQVQLRIPVTFDPKAMEMQPGQALDETPVSRYTPLVLQGLQEMFPEVKADDDVRQLGRMVSGGAAVQLREQLLAHPHW